jgi:two-component system, OmpR family, alkaline phosphatase synthesis response regulator PhoP
MNAQLGSMDMMTETLDWRPTLPARLDSVPEVIRVGPSVVHSRTGTVESPGGKQQLRAKELELLVHLYGHVTMTFSRGELLQRVWKYAPGLLTRTVDQTMATLRKKIESDPERPQFLQTVYGIGYRLVL